MMKKEVRFDIRTYLFLFFKNFIKSRKSLTLPEFEFSCLTEIRVDIQAQIEN